MFKLAAALLLIICLGSGTVNLGGEEIQLSYGYAAHYSDGLFQRVARKRKLPRHGCYISSDRHPIGTYVFVIGDRTGAARLCLVADVSQPIDRSRHLKDHLYELDYQTAQVICGDWFYSRWRDCPIRISIKSWPS